jgi:hypothetical protein
LNLVFREKMSFLNTASLSPTFISMEVIGDHGRREET